MLQEHFKSSRKKETKKCAHWDLHPWCVCQSIHVGRVKQERHLDSLSLSLEIIYSWNNSDFQTLATSKSLFPPPSSDSWVTSQQLLGIMTEIPPKVLHVLSLNSGRSRSETPPPSQNTQDRGSKTSNALKPCESEPAAAALALLYVTVIVPLHFKASLSESSRTLTSIKIN